MLALLLVIAGGSASLLLPRTDDGLIGLPDLKVGTVVPHTVRSPRRFEVVDPASTERVRQQAVSQVRPVFSHLLGRGEQVKELLQLALQRSAAGKEGSSPERLAEILGGELKAETIAPFFGPEQEQVLKDALLMVVDTIYEERIADYKARIPLRAPRGLSLRQVDKNGTVESEIVLLPQNYQNILSRNQARAKIDELAAQKLTHLNKKQQNAVAALAKGLLKANLVSDEQATLRRRRLARRNARQVVIPIRKGEVVINDGQRVNEHHLLVLQALLKAQSPQSRMKAALGSAVLMVLLAILGYRFASRSYRPQKPSHRDLAFLTSVYVSFLLLLWVGYKGVLSIAALPSLQMFDASIYRLLMPVGAGVLIVRLCAGAEAAAAFVPVIGLTAGWNMDGSLDFTAYTMAGCLAAASVDDTKPRAWLHAGIRAAMAQVLVVVCISLLQQEQDYLELLASAGAAIISGVMVSILVRLALPVVEVLFGYTTASKLLSLANLNHPLLRELLVEAPGTYHHSIIIGQLAEFGAAKIGANRLLARVGAYYHDIGKLKNPRIYDENDPGSLAVGTHRELVRAHTQEGVALATEHRLGAAVTEIIAQHHGDSLVMPLDSSEDRYNGSRPQTIEAALVLLADVVEAATREAVSRGIDQESLQEQVRQLVDEVIQSGQLGQSPLNMRHFPVLAEAFAEALEERRQKVQAGLSGIWSLEAGVPVVAPPPRGEPN